MGVEPFHQVLQILVHVRRKPLEVCQLAPLWLWERLLMIRWGDIFTAVPEGDFLWPSDGCWMGVVVMVGAEISTEWEGAAALPQLLCAEIEHFSFVFTWWHVHYHGAWGQHQIQKVSMWISEDRKDGRWINSGCCGHRCGCLAASSDRSVTRKTRPAIAGCLFCTRWPVLSTPSLANSSSIPRDPKQEQKTDGWFKH